MPFHHFGRSISPGTCQDRDSQKPGADNPGGKQKIGVSARQRLEGQGRLLRRTNIGNPVFEKHLRSRQDDEKKTTFARIIPVFTSVRIRIIF